jgi:hypothetical protein
MLDQFLNRLIVLYGHPDTADEDAFIEEYRDMLRYTGDDVLKRAGDIIRASHKRRAWPTPGEIMEAVTTANKQLHPPSMPSVPVPPKFEWVGRGDPRFERALAKAKKDAPAYAAILERNGKLKILSDDSISANKHVVEMVRQTTARMVGDK